MLVTLTSLSDGSVDKVMTKLRKNLEFYGFKTNVIAPLEDENGSSLISAVTKLRSYIHHNANATISDTLSDNANKIFLSIIKYDDVLKQYVSCFRSDTVYFTTFDPLEFIYKTDTFINMEDLSFFDVGDKLINAYKEGILFYYNHVQDFEETGLCKYLKSLSVGYSTKGILKEYLDFDYGMRYDYPFVKNIPSTVITSNPEFISVTEIKRKVKLIRSVYSKLGFTANSLDFLRYLLKKDRDILFRSGYLNKYNILRPGVKDMPHDLIVDEFVTRLTTKYLQKASEWRLDRSNVRIETY